LIITSLFFALYHVNPWFFPFYFILSCFFGAVLNRTGNLGMAVLAHFINNLFGVVMYYIVGFH